jgi:hypothetical protein
MSNEQEKALNEFKNMIDSLSLSSIFLIEDALTNHNNNFTRMVIREFDIFPSQTFCESCYNEGNVTILSGWEKYCPICGKKFIKEKKIK